MSLSWFLFAFTLPLSGLSSLGAGGKSRYRHAVSGRRQLPGSASGTRVPPGSNRLPSWIFHPTRESALGPGTHLSFLVPQFGGRDQPLVDAARPLVAVLEHCSVLALVAKLSGGGREDRLFCFAFFSFSFVGGRCVEVRSLQRYSFWEALWSPDASLPLTPAPSRPRPWLGFSFLLGGTFDPGNLVILTP